MEEQKVQYRIYREEDFPAVVRLIEEVWEYEAVGTPQLARSLAELDLLRYLRVRSFGQVVEREGELAGFLLGGRTDTAPDPRYDFRLRQARRGLRRSLRGLALTALDGLLDQVYRKLQARGGRTYDAQLLYFALREDCRGLGIGGTLYRSFCTAMADQGAKTFYLLTDTASSYGFYEHFGMVRRAVCTVPLSIWQEGGTEFYLYDGNCGQMTVGE